MAYVKEHAPSEVYHLTKKENLNSILEDGTTSFMTWECRTKKCLRVDTS